MQPTCVHNVAMRATVRECGRGGNSLIRWSERSCRRYATSKRTPPAAVLKQLRKTPKPLPFEPAKPKQAPNPKSKSARSPPPTSSSASSRGHEDKKQPMSEMVRTRWFPLFGAGAAVACVGFFAASLTMYWWTHPAEHWMPGEEPETPTGRPSIQSPREFDQHLDKSEWRYGITKLRRRIAADMARGHVLEVAIGTGRNFDYYDWSVVTQGLEPAKEEEKKGWFNWMAKDEAEKENGSEKKETAGGKDEKEKVKEEKAKAVKPPPPKLKAKPQPKNENAILSFTGLDIAPPMLDLALTRIRQVVPHMADQVPKKPSFSKLASKTIDSEESISLAHGKIRLLKADAQQAPLPPPPSSPTQKYDTIIQTFGLCSVRDPVQLLTTIAGSLQPNSGRIILLEHGRSSWVELVNGLLDRSAREHFARFGCWWNRDVEVVVRAAARAVPGLEVLRLERPGWATLGTHVLVEMRVRGDAAATIQKPKGDGLGKEGSEEEEDKRKTKMGWFSSLLYVGGSEKPKKDD
ncbi:hypothetical protein F4677DRAFT_425944 [Hypoxylon crocopeplum]|nr:hypothetical protein F4677DRAFT_425944 [Hypoxylon crocopeplum]